MKRVRFLALTLTFALFAGCAFSGGDRHGESGHNSSFSYIGDSFSGYIEHSRRLIAENRTDLNTENRDEIIEGNSPFLLLPDRSCPKGVSHEYRRGILLAHGLTDSPYDMRALGQFFVNECFYVQALLLPGHGTRPGDLISVRWDEWVKAFSFGVRTLKARVDEVYLGGFSTGGTLAIHHAMSDGDIDGLFLFSPAVEITPAADRACWLAKLGRIFSRFAWLTPPMPDEDPFKYESFTANAACQVFRLTEELEKVTAKTPLTKPLFVAASADDATVHTSKTLELFFQAPADPKKMVLYARPGRMEAPNIQVVDSSHPEGHVVSSAHTAIVIPPEDAHYGAGGQYAFCSHYYGKDDAAYLQCKEKREDLLGEISGEFLTQGVVRRLTYNPGYREMLNTMREFIATLPE